MLGYVTVWWVWLAAALVLASLEVLIPGFVFLGFAIGAGVTGLALLGPLGWLSPALIVLLFAALSMLAWLLLHRFFSLPKGQVTRFDRDIND